MAKVGLMNDALLEKQSGRVRIRKITIYRCVIRHARQKTLKTCISTSRRAAGLQRF